MGRVVRIVVSALVALALGLSVASPALAQGSTTTPSAGDNQYIDPLAPPARPHHKRKHSPASSGQQGSTTSTSSASSSGQSQPSSTGQVAAPSTSATGYVAAPTAPAHKKRAKSSHRPKTKTAPAAATKTTATTAAASPSAAINPPSHSGDSFPIVYVIVAACAALMAGLLGRHLMVRRTARHG